MEQAVFPCAQASGSCAATDSAEAIQASASAEPSRLHRLATLPQLSKRGRQGARALRGPDLRQTRVLLHALCSMRLELYAGHPAWCDGTLASRRADLMALWEDRPREIFTQPDVERGIEARLDAAFVHAQAGSAREAAGEFKRAYLLLCCVLTHARDQARRTRTAPAAPTGTPALA
ncbi:MULTISPECIES: hypothetical protein [unclassified Cupriavidus]|uniref:hypothetical protein n=1 Tax=unclassified Cupriavidus TaxID=2640874 RepID=UPI00313CA4EE